MSFSFLSVSLSLHCPCLFHSHSLPPGPLGLSLLVSRWGSYPTVWQAGWRIWCVGAGGREQGPALSHAQKCLLLLLPLLSHLHLKKGWILFRHACFWVPFQIRQYSDLICYEQINPLSWSFVANHEADIWLDIFLFDFWNNFISTEINQSQLLMTLSSNDTVFQEIPTSKDRRSIKKWPVSRCWHHTDPGMSRVPTE